MSREKMAQAIVQGWDGAPEAHLVARIVEALAAVERETIGRAAKIANKWDSFVAKQILEAIQDFQQDGSPPERKPSALRPEEEGTEAGDMSRTAAPLGAPKSTSSKERKACRDFCEHGHYWYNKCRECGRGMEVDDGIHRMGHEHELVARTQKIDKHCPICLFYHAGDRNECDSCLAPVPTQTVLNGCNHTARRALCDECFQKAMALACEAGRGLTVVHYTDKDIPRLLSEIARLKTAKAPADSQPQTQYLKDEAEGQQEGFDEEALEDAAMMYRADAPIPSWVDHLIKREAIGDALAKAFKAGAAWKARPATSGGKND